MNNLKINSKYTKLLSLALLVSGASALAASQAAFAQSSNSNEATPELFSEAFDGRESMERKGPGHHGKGGMLFGEDVERSIEDIENGVIITLTSEDASVVEKLQNFPDKENANGPFGEKVIKEKILIDNGIQITLTSEDVSVVEKLQNMPKEGGRHPLDNLNVTKTVESIENGIVITITSEDAEVVKKLQERVNELE